MDKQVPALWQHLAARRVRLPHSVIRSAIVAGLAFFVGTIATMDGFRTGEDILRTTASSLRTTQASGQLHIVEMDAASMAQYRRWPWPRIHYAAAVDRLNAAGVRSIAFDVDFSAASDPASDRALADALARSRAEIILPTFSQSASFRSNSDVSEQRVLDALPIPALRDHVVLGSVSVLPDSDGMVRAMPLGTITAGIPRPALSVQIAKQSGAVGQAFPVDFAIDPASIPRHSFANIERGTFDAESLRGKDVLIGATAIELFDRYAVPGHGVIPGVILQALAVETLYDGVPSYWGYPLPLLLAAIAGFMIHAGESRRSVFRRTISVATLLLSGWAVLWIGLRVDIAIVPALVLLAAIAAIRATGLLYQQKRLARLTDTETSLPNLRALEAQIAHTPRKFAVAAMIDEYDTIRAVIGRDEFATLAHRIVDRLRVAGCDLPVYRVDDRVLAWTTDLELYELEDQLAGLRALMRSPVEIAGRRLDTSLYFGIAEAGAIGGAIHAASQAMRQKEPWRYHEDAQSAALAQQISLMGELDEGVENGQLQVFYQPKVDLRSDDIASVEALIRWQHPTRGFLRPDMFIPLAEENDRIADLTLFVLRRTIDDLLHWCERGVVIGAAINISAKLLTSPSFTQRAHAILRESGVPRNRLTFEVTESAEMQDPEKSREALLKLCALGVSISMDDYGTGQSTLSYLKNLPLSELKIDRSFVQFAHTNKGDAMLVRSTVQLAHELGLKVVAEGVEDAECLHFLKSIQCDYAQGYLIGKPMTAVQLLELMRQRGAMAA